MVWRLKDKKLEADLNKFSNGEFSKRLNEVVKSGASSIRLTINDGKVAIFLDGRDLEHMQDYNPNAWNEYPAVTPPEHTWMRVELLYPNGNKRHLGLRFVNEKWMDETGAVYQCWSCERVRFRPWGD